MSQSHIVLTQTYVDKQQAMELVGATFFRDGGFNFSSDLSGNLKLVDTDNGWEHLRSSGVVIVQNLENKKDFTDSLMDFYDTYPQPTLLFLGDLSELSLPAQEGMLKLLEEPPRNLNIVLFAQNRSGILPTITSRCQFHVLPQTLVMQLLDKKLLEKTQTKLPKAADFVKDFLANKPLNLPDTKNLERDEIDFWLWQVGVYLEMFYKQQPHPSYLEKISRLTEAKQLNLQNLQKKFVFGWLGV